MKFRISNNWWEIKFISHEALKAQYKKDTGIECNFVGGYCNYNTDEIVLSDLACWSETIRALRHELTHCFMHTFGHVAESYTDEQICCIAEELVPFVDGIVEQFENEQQEKQIKGKKEMLSKDRIAEANKAKEKK